LKSKRENGRSPASHSWKRVFGSFLAAYGLIWIAVLIGFVSLSYPLLKRFATDQMEIRLRTDAALAEEYMTAMGADTDSCRPILAQVCRRLSQPSLLDAHLTLFSPKAEAIADSRFENPLAFRSSGRPEVRAALRKKVGTAIRYSRMDRRRMAFLAYPHVHLGEVAGVIRIGIPYDSIDGAIWILYLKIAMSGLGLTVVAASCSTLLRGFYPFPRRSDPDAPI
jgi:hypothetical protein